MYNPGDVLVEDGHVELAAQVENGEITRVYNCGWDGAIQSEGTIEYPETVEVSNKNDQVRLVLRPSGDISSTKKETNNKSSSKAEEKASTNPTGTGEAKIDKCNIENGGYDAIFTSGTTGRQFKEFKQNINNNTWNNNKYPIIGLLGVWSSGWGAECSTVAMGIIGSGYTSQATFEDMWQKMKDKDGYTQIPGWMNSYTGQNSSRSDPSEEEFKNAIANGCVAFVHDPYYSENGHYMAVLDISKDKSQIYISNPDVFARGADGVQQGWNSISSVYSKFDEVYLVTNDGSKVNYGAGGSSSGSSSTSSVNMSGNITEIKDPDNPNRSGYKINVDWDKEVDSMLETLKNKDYKLEKYLDKSLQKEYLKNMLKAAIVTQYPDLRSADEIASDAEIPADETQGCIKIKRYADGETQAFAGNSLSNPVDSEDGGMYLEYMPYSDFSELINEGNISAMNYFSMDSSNNLVVAGWETLDVSVTIEQIEGEPDPNPDSAPEPRAKEYAKLVEKKINYVNQVSNYTMPFSYLWTLLVYGNDEDFVNDVAKLVIDTDIVITSYDATTTKKSTYTNEYDKHNRTEDQVYINDKNTGNTTYVDHVYTYRVTEIHILKTDIPSLNVVYANTWVAIYNKNYKVVYKDSNDGEGETIELEDDVIDQDYGQATDEKQINERLENNEEAQANVENERQRLKQEAHDYNQANFSYRYDIINEKVNNELLKIEDVQNYLINMIIDQNTERYIKDTFKTNEIIVDYAKEITGSDNHSEMLEEAATEANKIVREANDIYLKNATNINNLTLETDIEEFKKNLMKNGTTLWKELTKDGENTGKNQTYEVKITSIQYQDIEKRENQTENIKTEKNTAKVEEVTSNNNNVKFKTDKNSNENSFVKLLYHSKKAKGNLKIIDSWFFESMEETAAIADMVDLTKYLFQKVYNEKITYTKEEVTEMANLFDPEKMSSVSRKQTSAGTIVGGASYSSITISDEDLQVLYKLVQAEGGGGTHEQVMYITCTILNRILSSTFNVNTVSEVANASGQFEVMWNGMYDAAVPSADTIDAVNEAIQTGDITGGSIGFQNDWLYDSQYPNQTYETPIELLRETWPGGSVVVFFTTASIQAELSQYK